MVTHSERFGGEVRLLLARLDVAEAGMNQAGTEKQERGKEGAHGAVYGGVDMG
jgi:hypothetical protein